MIIFNDLQTSMSGGLGRYSYELSKAIYLSKKINIKLIIRNQDLNLFDFANKKDLFVIDNITDSIKRNYFEQFILPDKIYRLNKKAIYHNPDIMLPVMLKNKSIITVHDMAFKSFKGSFTLKSTIWKNLIMGKSIKKADAVISITNFTKDEISKYYPNYNKKINMIYNGFNNFSNDVINYSNIRKKFLNFNNYLLTVSTISPRKNIDGLIKAFSIIKDMIDYKLVIAGKKGWLYQDVFNIVKELKLEDRVIFTEKVNDDELKYLYKNAKIFIYPSFYEGFGLPPLEAMSYGIPCVISDIPSLHEVAEDAAYYFNPYDIKDMAEKIKLLCINKNELLITKGYKSIKKYSWNKCANETIELYKKLINA